MASVRVVAPWDSDPPATAARLVLDVGRITGKGHEVLEVRLTARACGQLAAALMKHAGRDVRAKIEDGFRPLVDMANRLNKMLGDGED